MGLSSVRQQEYHIGLQQENCVRYEYPTNYPNIYTLCRRTAGCAQAPYHNSNFVYLEQESCVRYKTTTKDPDIFIYSGNAGGQDLTLVR